MAVSRRTGTSTTRPAGTTIPMMAAITATATAMITATVMPATATGMAATIITDLRRVG